ncbi:MAG: glycosyltransferase family 4 protein [Fidelibacterota bacterium]
MLPNQRTSLVSLRILILSHFYPPEIGGAAARLHGLARWLIAYGHQVSVITGFPNYPTGLVPEHYRGKVHMREVRDRVEVIRTWVYASSHRTSFGRLANYFSFVISSVIAVFRLRGEFDVLVASSPPLVIGVPARIVSRRYRIPLVFDVRDIWPDVAVDAGAFKPNNPMIRLGRKLARYLYAISDHITPVTEIKRKKLIAEGVREDKITVVPNGVDFDRLNQSEAHQWTERLHLRDHFVVIYTGLIGIAQGVGIIVEAAGELRDNPRIHFLIVGDGVEREHLMGRCTSLGLDNVTFISSQPRTEIPSLLASADLAVVPLVSEDLVDAVPSKLMEAWACRRPVLVAAAGEAAELVETAGGGVVVPPGEPVRLARAVEDLFGNRAALERCAKRGQAYAKSHFDRRNLARRMEKVLLAVTRGSSA